MSTIQVRPPGRVRLTVEEFARIQDAGLFEGRHVQLLDGELYEVTKNPPHNFAVSALAGPTHDVGEARASLLPRDEYAVREEKPIEPWRYWWPEPDIAVARDKQRRYDDRHPRPRISCSLSKLLNRRSRTGRRSSSDMPRPGSRSTGSSTWPCAGSRFTAIQGPSGRAPGTGWVEEMVPEGGFVELVIDQRSFGWIAVAENLPRAMEQVAPGR